MMYDIPKHLIIAIRSGNIDGIQAEIEAHAACNIHLRGSRLIAKAILIERNSHGIGLPDYIEIDSDGQPNCLPNDGCYQAACCSNPGPLAQQRGETK